MIELPMKVSPPVWDNIDLMVVFGFNKVGKTSNVLQLPNSFLLDLEGSGGYYEGRYLNIKDVEMSEKIGPATAMLRIAERISEKNKENGSPIYDYIIIDSLSKMEDIANAYATSLYKKSIVGANFTGTDVTAELAKGAGYLWLWKAFEKLLSSYRGLARTLILIGRVKESSINKGEQEIEAIDLDLTGKLKKIVGYDCSAIGIMRKAEDDPNTNILSFVNSSDNLATGARISRLANKEFVISKRDPDTGDITTYWENIFPNLKK